VSGVRPVPDEPAEIVTNLIAPVGKQPPKWSQKEFGSAVKDHMKRPLCLMATNGGLGRLNFRAARGRHSSAERAASPSCYGNGLLLLQSFRAGNLSENEAIRVAFSLNASELTKNPTGYGFGSYCHKDGCVHFTSFLPNAAHRPGLLPSFYYAGASRALAMPNRLENADWKS
jgi:hypothetical protein